MKEMEELQLTDSQKELIERLGVFQERSGMSPAVARIMALLLVADRTELTFEEILQALQLSKSAVSNGLNFLLDTGKIEYITKPGDRKRYFRSKIVQWTEEFSKRFHSIFEVIELFREILAQRPAETEEFNRNLEDIISFIEFMQGRIPQLYEQWRESRV